jgi:hemerythrin-like domain-containing protein
MDARSTMTATAKSKQHGSARNHAPKTKRSGRSRRPSTASSLPSLGKTAAKMMAGAADAVRSLFPRETGADTATALLEKQHRELERSFATALGTEDARIRRSAMNDIIRQLTTHTRIEETIFYPAVRALDTEKAKDMILEAFEEHHVVKLLLKELPKVDPKAETFEAKLTVLKELIEHHVEEEEQEMFPMAERKLGPDLSRELADAMAVRAARE